MSNKLLTLAGAALLVSGPAFAQMDQPAEKAPAPTMEESAAEIIPAEKQDQLRAETLIGMTVVDTAGEKVGSVGDIVIDKDGKVSGLVVEAGGFLGIGSKAVAISWQDIETASQSDVVTISLTRDDLARAPEFKPKEDEKDMSTESSGSASKSLDTSSPTPLEPSDKSPEQ